MQTAFTRAIAPSNTASDQFFVLSTAVSKVSKNLSVTAIACVALAAAFFTLVAPAAASSSAPADRSGVEQLRPTKPLFPSLPDSSRGEAVIENGAAQVVAQLLVTSEQPTRVGVLFDLAPGWHLYWRNPGETGIAPDLEFESAGHAFGPIEWPAPKTFREADGLFTTYGYEERVLLSAPLIPRKGESKSGSMGVHASVLVCHTQCVPATFDLTTPLQNDAKSEERHQIDALFDEAAKRVPAELAALDLSSDAYWLNGNPGIDETGSVLLSLRTCAGAASATANDAADSRANRTGCSDFAIVEPEIAFLPFEDETFEVAPETALAAPAAVPASFGSGSSESLTNIGQRLAIALKITRLEAGEARLRGVIPLRDENGRIQHVRVDLPIRDASSSVASMASMAKAEGAGAAPIVPTGPTGNDGQDAGAPLQISLGQWIRILFLALLGGLILNGMPCVLPVLAIKVVAVADMAEKDPREVRMHGLAYTGGVLASMAALAAIVLSLRAAGHAVGWGFQFQEPIFVAAISALLVGFALNLFGVFEIEMGQGRLASVGQSSTGVQRSAFEGLLAVILATPCTAPFLGTAVGFAFATSGYGIVTIFLAIGLGLAAPFLLVSFFPALARFIPRSGPWMLKLRAGLGFSLLATVVWLLWVLGQSGGADAVVAMIGALLLFSFLLWGFGQLQPLRSVWLGRFSVIAIVCVALTSFNLIDFESAEKGAGDALSSSAEAGDLASASSGATDAEGFAPYSEAAVEKALAKGQPAFVVFTADWCITCKMNEKTVLARERVREAFTAGGYALFKADWTRRDDRIRARLADFGRAGVPLYLVYSPESPDEPQVLSELLSQREVVEALEGPQLASRP